MKNSSKKVVFILLLQMLSSIGTYSLAVADNGGVKSGEGIKAVFESYGQQEGKGAASFTVYSEEAKVCDLSFMALPAEYTDGGFLSYTVKVNGSVTPGKITFTQSGWQHANTVGNSVYLNKGKNTVAFISADGNIPQIRGIRIYDGHTNFTEGKIPVAQLQSYPGEAAKMGFSRTGSPRYISSREPLFRRGMQMDQPYCYTFFMPIYYEKGDWTNFYGPTKWDTMYGIYESTVESNLYFFYEKPELFSVSSQSEGKRLYLQVDSIPYTGLYYLLVEAKNPGEYGGVTLLIDNTTLYKYNFVSNTSFNIFKDAPMGGIYPTNTDSCYNMFTVNPRAASANALHDADPCLWLKTKNSATGNFIIAAYNDNNTVRSDYNWANNARIRSQLSDQAQNEILLSSSYPTFATADTCDIYHSIWNSPGYAIDKSFPNLKYEDAIESCRFDENFNCISWTCGENNVWLWPRVDTEISWFDKLYNNEEVSNGFGIYKRADGSLKYTRDGATAENSVIDIWGQVENGDTIFTHGSIRKYSDAIPHGYDWESKCGASVRIFHPRYSLADSDASKLYGHVVAHYRIADGQALPARSQQMMLAESIADGETVVESISLTPEDEWVLEDGISAIPAKKQEEFEQLYGNWKRYTDARQFESNMWKFRDCNEYARLLECANSINNGALLAYDKFLKGNMLAAVLIKDLSVKPGSSTAKIWNDIMDAPLTENTVRPPRYNVTLFIKSVLQKSATPVTEGYKRSNDDEFGITVSSGEITVNLDIKEPSRYSVQVLNLESDYVYKLSPEASVAKGYYTHKCNLSPGLYVVSYILNGNINSKKIVVR